MKIHFAIHAIKTNTKIIEIYYNEYYFKTLKNLGQALITQNPKNDNDCFYIPNT